MHRRSGESAGSDQVGLIRQFMIRVSRPASVPMVGALAGLTALLGIACGSDTAEPVQVVPRVATATPQSQAAPAAIPTATATPRSDAESVVGSSVPTPPAEPEAQPDPPGLGTQLINITLPRAGSEEVVDLATFDPDKNIVIVFYRAFW